MDSSQRLHQKIAPRTTFKLLGIPVGSELVFIHDQNIRCQTADHVNKVMFRGSVTTLSRIANATLGGHLNGFNYFTYNGQKLADLRRQLDRDYQ